MKLDITSTTLEKGIDLAKGFLEKLIGPTVEETGLLIKDQIANWRFRNQIRVLNKALEYCEKNKINPKQISFKLICPILEYASLEEDEKLQDKWSVLISNLVDSEQNIENHVFPYILSQLSAIEYQVLDRTYLDKVERIQKLNIEYENFKKEYPEKEKAILESIEKHSKDIFNKLRLDKELRDLKRSEKKIQSLLDQREVLDHVKLKEFELSNLVRLGLIKNVIEHYVYSEPLRIPRQNEYEYGDVQLDLDIGIDQDANYYILTELGELFIKACSEKEKL